MKTQSLTRLSLLLTLVAPGLACAQSRPAPPAMAAPAINYATQNITFPADAGVINVKDFGAKGDGKTDDTRAIQDALDRHMGGFRILYFPNGTYLVTDKLTFGGDIGRAKQFVMQGQSEAGTIIKLADYMPGYEAGQRKFLLTMWEGGSTGQAFHNFIYNMTFDVGKGNPGGRGFAVDE